MAIKKSKPYIYGADADGNRYEVLVDYTIISDISGEELTNENNIFIIDDMFMSRKEFMDYIRVKEMSSGIYPIIDTNKELDASKESIYYVGYLGEYMDDNTLFSFIYSHKYVPFEDLDKYFKKGDEEL